MKLEDYKGKRILITGGTGFVGKNLVPYLQKLGAEVFVFGSKDCDLRDKEQTDILFARYSNIDFIFHGAALQGAGDYTLKHPAEQLYANSLIHANVLEAWYRYQPQARLIGFGSTCSYPGDKDKLAETDYLTGRLHDSVQYYGLTKMLMQQGIEAYKTQYGLKGTTVAFATLYGPHDDFDINRAHVVSALVMKFCNAKKQNLPTVEVWGDGTQLRELIYVDDQIRGLLTTADYDGALLNIGSGTETSVRTLAESIKFISGFQGEIVYNTNRFVGVLRKVLDVSLAKELYGWTVSPPLLTLGEGLERTIHWYENNY